MYLDLFDAVWFPVDQPSDHSLREALLPIIVGYSTTLKQCRSDHYHWTRLAQPLHQVEPDVIDVLLVVDWWLRARQESISRVVRGIPLGPETLLLLGGALEQYNAWEPQ